VALAYRGDFEVESRFEDLVGRLEGVEAGLRQRLLLVARVCFDADAGAPPPTPFDLAGLATVGHDEIGNLLEVLWVTAHDLFPDYPDRREMDLHLKFADRADEWREETLKYRRRQGVRRAIARELLATAFEGGLMPSDRDLAEAAGCDEGEVGGHVRRLKKDGLRGLPFRLDWRQDELDRQFGGRLDWEDRVTFLRRQFREWPIFSTAREILAWVLINQVPPTPGLIGSTGLASARTIRRHFGDVMRVAGEVLLTDEQLDERRRIEEAWGE
jgi:hypothetical protein